MLSGPLPLQGKLPQVPETGEGFELHQEQRRLQAGTRYGSPQEWHRAAPGDGSGRRRCAKGNERRNHFPAPQVEGVPLSKLKRTLPPSQPLPSPFPHHTVSFRFPSLPLCAMTSLDLGCALVLVGLNSALIIDLLQTSSCCARRALSHRTTRVVVERFLGTISLARNSPLINYYRISSNCSIDPPATTFQPSSRAAVCITLLRKPPKNIRSLPFPAVPWRSFLNPSLPANMMH